MAKPKRLKTILIGAAIGLVAVGLSIGGTFYVLSGQHRGVAADETSAVPFVPVPIQYFEFGKPFVTAVAQAERARYLQVSVALGYRDPTAEPGLETHRPLLRSRLLTLFGSADFMTLQSEQGRLTLKSDALATVNGILENEGAAKVEQVFFTNFVLQ